MKDKKNKKFTCPHCKKTGEYKKKVNYCPFCGGKISSETKALE